MHSFRLYAARPSRRHAFLYAARPSRRHAFLYAARPPGGIFLWRSEGLPCWTEGPLAVQKSRAASGNGDQRAARRTAPRAVS